MPPPFRGNARSRFATSAVAGGSSRRGQKRAPAPVVLPQPQVEGPVKDERAITAEFGGDGKLLSQKEIGNIRGTLSTFLNVALGQNLAFDVEVVYNRNTRLHRATAHIDESINIVAIGEAPSIREAQRLACLSACYQLAAQNLLHTKTRIKPKAPSETATVTLSDGSEVNFERARQFMDYYCRTYNFNKPEIDYQTAPGRNSKWEAAMIVGGRRIGIGVAASKKQALERAYLDVTQYLEECDKELWKAFVEAAKTGKDIGLAPKVLLQTSGSLAGEISDVCEDIKGCSLYQNRPIAHHTPLIESERQAKRYERPSESFFTNKSKRLKTQLDEYRKDPKMEKMRTTRESLPVYSKFAEFLKVVEDNNVTICMAATGSGKTTQVPQLILDSWIDADKGAKCNIICTQPRRIAAISVAERVAKERGETAGKGSVGYQVRFEAKLPVDHGSITFCTTGIFMKRMQSALEGQASSGRSLDDVTHIIVDEVHERDVDTDLVLVVLKRLLEDRKKRGIPLKIILMSATINPTLFQNYFCDDKNIPAPVSEIPGRSFPVHKRFLEDVLQDFGGPSGVGASSSWVFHEPSVATYINAEAGPLALAKAGFASAAAAAKPKKENSSGEDLDMPLPLLALTIAHVLKRSEDGHVLVFLPGWDEISALQKMLMDRSRNFLDINFGQSEKYSVHILHSSVPVADQQKVFDPAPEGQRRIILSTNIAETSVTIPDVVYVVDSGKVKEQRYDHDRRISSLISAWVGSSNLNQRAGRAGRHRPGEYYGMVSNARLAKLNPYQLVEIKRVDLSNVVMHIKALNFPGMEVEDVLAMTIEPPEEASVQAAIENLKTVGALDSRKNLTPLGRVLLQIPIDVQMGRMLLFGSFFRCLDNAVTLAAILTNRDPFMSPPLLKKEAHAKKVSFTPPFVNSDPLASLNAYNQWAQMQERGEYSAANQFCHDNFLGKLSLLNIQRLRGHLVQSLYHAGVIAVSAGGTERQGNTFNVPPELNTNAESLPLLSALVAIGAQPNFAIRTGPTLLRTQTDRAVIIHPSSVNHRKWGAAQEEKGEYIDKQIFTFSEKVRNVSVPGSNNAQTYIRGTTKLDPMTYLLFGAHELVVTERGLECDGWLPMIGNVSLLDDVQDLKSLMEACLLRIYQGILYRRREDQRLHPNSRVPAGLLRNRQESDEDDDDDEEITDSNQAPPKDLSLTPAEIREFDFLTQDIVRILDRFSEERAASSSRMPSRPGTPLTAWPSALNSAYNSGYNTPVRTPSGMGRRLELPRVHTGPSTPYGSRPVTPSKADGLWRQTAGW